MSQTVVWSLAILAGLFLVLRRFFRHRPSLTEYQEKRLEEVERLREAARHEAGTVSDAEALRPALAALEELCLPPGVILLIEEIPAVWGGAEVRLSLQKADPASDNAEKADERQPLFSCIAGHTRFRLDASPHATLDGQWLLRREQDPGRPETFDDLAAFSARLETLITGSLHDFSDKY